MKNQVLKISLGFLLTWIYYSLGYLLPLLIQNYLPNLKSNVGTPGLDFLSIILVAFGGLIWLITSLIKTIRNGSRYFYIGALIGNIIVWLFIIVKVVIN